MVREVMPRVNQEVLTAACRKRPPQAWRAKCQRLTGYPFSIQALVPPSTFATVAQPLRRPQIGFGNPQAPVLFLSPSPLDIASTTNDAFTEWLDHEAGLEHHMTSQTPHPYFQFARSVLQAARRRLGQPPAKHDVLDMAFHTW